MAWVWQALCNLFSVPIVRIELAWSTKLVYVPRREGLRPFDGSGSDRRLVLSSFAEVF